MPWSQLHWCAFRNDAQGIKKLTSPGAFCCRKAMAPDTVDKVRGDMRSLGVLVRSTMFTPLYIRHVSVFHLLLSLAGAVLAGQAGATPLHVACAHGQCHAVEALISAGADSNAETIWKKPIVRLPVPRVLQLCLACVPHPPTRAQADQPTDADRAGETPLHWVVKLRYKPEDLHYVGSVREEVHSGHTLCARYLLRAGADVNAQVVSFIFVTLHNSELVYSPQLRMRCFRSALVSECTV